MSVLCNPNGMEKKNTLHLDEIKEVYNRYKEQSSKVNKTTDDFFAEMKEMKLDDEDKKFDMIKPVQQGMDLNQFMNQFETR